MTICNCHNVVATLNMFCDAARKHMLKRTTDSESEDANVCDAKKLKQTSSEEKSDNAVESHAGTQNDTSITFVF